VNNDPFLNDVGIIFLMLGIGVSFIGTGGEFKVGIYQVFDPGNSCWYMADPECMRP
jgi:hypothetical protein